MHDWYTLKQCYAYPEIKKQNPKSLMSSTLLLLISFLLCKWSWTPGYGQLYNKRVNSSIGREAGLGYIWIIYKLTVLWWNTPSLGLIISSFFLIKIVCRISCTYVYISFIFYIYFIILGCHLKLQSYAYIPKRKYQWTQWGLLLSSIYRVVVWIILLQFVYKFANIRSLVVHD